MSYKEISKRIDVRPMRRMKHGPSYKWIHRIICKIRCAMRPRYNFLPKGVNAKNWLDENKLSADRIVDSINASSRIITLELSAMSVVALVLIFTLVMVDDKTLILQADIALPQDIANIDIVSAYIFLPLVFLLIHASLISTLNETGEKIKVLNQVLPSNAMRLSMFSHAFLRIYISSLNFLPLLLVLIGVVFIPLGLLVAISGAFLRYQHAGITLFHQFLIIFDVVLLAWFLFYLPRSMIRRRDLILGFVLSLGIFSLYVAAVSHFTANNDPTIYHVISFKDFIKDVLPSFIVSDVKSFIAFIKNFPLSFILMSLLALVLFVISSICKIINILSGFKLEGTFYIAPILLTVFIILTTSTLDNNDTQIKLSFSNGLFNYICETWTHSGNSRWGCLSVSLPNEDLFMPPSEEVLAIALLTEKEKTSETLEKLRQSLSGRRNLKNRSFRLADFHNTNFIRADLTRANFEEATLKKANFKGAILRGAILREAHLEGANLSGAHLEGANLSDAHLEGAILRFVRLEGANLSSARLEGAILRGAHLEGADLSSAHLGGAILFDAYLEGANLREAHLAGANLLRAQLEGADLRGTYLAGALFNESSLHGADFEGAEPVGSQWLGVITMNTNIPFKGNQNISFLEWHEEAKVNGYINHLNGRLPASVGRWHKEDFLAKLKKKLTGRLGRKDSREEMDYQVLLDLACKSHWIAKGILRNQLYPDIPPDTPYRSKGGPPNIIQIDRKCIPDIKFRISEKKQRCLEAQWQVVADLFLTEIEGVANGYSCPGLKKIMKQEIDGHDPAIWMEDLRVLAGDNPRVFQCPKS